MAKTKAFDINVKQYEAWFEKNKYAYESELLAVKKALPQLGIGVEVGVGSGRFAQPLGINLGIEPAKKMRQQAVKRGIKVLDATAEKIPFKDRSFDFVLMVTTICFLDDVEKACREIFRIVKENGAVIIGFVDKDSPLGKRYRKYKDDSVFYKEAIFYSTDEVVSYLQKAGFSDFCFYQTIFKPLHSLRRIESVKEGYGLGSFVVIKGIKKEYAWEDISRSEKQ
ncbi:MAG: class I SAM-dependent methyltransferase [Spirochaetales bacterium]|nr:class I SAM-dependent methyltransferase [Spirochaetales bacterium]